MGFLHLPSGTVQVSVKVGDEMATEYPDPDAADGPNIDGEVPKIRYYIESQDDANYEIHFWLEEGFLFPDPAESICFRVYVDGKWQRSKILQQDHRHYGPTIVEGRKELVDGQLCLRKFRFAKVNTTDGPARNPAIDVKRVKNIGTIKVVVMLEVVTGVSSPQLPTFGEDGKLDLHEKDLKGRAVSHGTSFEPGVPTCRTSMVKTRNLGPLGVFTFKYRSREALQQEMVIPRSPPPVPKDEDQNIQNVKKEENPRVKQERKRPFEAIVDLTDDPEPRIYKAKKEGGKLVFDLTDD